MAENSGKKQVSKIFHTCGDLELVDYSNNPDITFLMTAAYVVGY